MCLDLHFPSKAKTEGTWLLGKHITFNDKFSRSGRNFVYMKLFRDFILREKEVAGEGKPGFQL